LIAQQNNQCTEDENPAKMSRFSSAHPDPLPEYMERGKSQSGIALRHRSDSLHFFLPGVLGALGGSIHLPPAPKML
jgi:hypothetical protein